MLPIRHSLMTGGDCVISLDTVFLLRLVGTVAIMCYSLTRTDHSMLNGILKLQNEVNTDLHLERLFTDPS